MSRVVGRMWRKGLFVCSLCVQCGRGAECKGHPCTNKDVPWDYIGL